MAIVLVGALIIGLTLGMLGSGGSAITVPVLVYLVGHGAKESIAESMAIVGLISIIAAVPYARGRQVDWHSVLYFGLPGMMGTFIGAWLGGLVSGTVQLIFFGLVLLAAARAMLQKPKAGALPETGDDKAPSQRSPLWKIATEGTFVGVVTGFVGVGGGFLIVPALVVMGRLPMRLAIGTSLVIIAIKAAVGFAKYEQHLLAHNTSVDWETIIAFTLIGVAGSFVGKAINAKLNQALLKQVFAGFLVVLGGFVIVQQGYKLANPTPEPAAAAAVPATVAATTFESLGSFPSAL